jgi:hypothetical protein
MSLAREEFAAGVGFVPGVQLLPPRGEPARRCLPLIAAAGCSSPRTTPTLPASWGRCFVRARTLPAAERAKALPEAAWAKHRPVLRLRHHLKQALGA